MGMLDKVVAAMAPEPTVEEKMTAREEARAASGGSGWLSMVLDHHEQVEALFEKIKAAKSASSRRNAQRQLASLLTAHSIAEEGVLYPAMALTDQKGHATEAYAEQSAAKVQLTALDDLEPMSQDYLDNLEHLRAAVSHHVYEEEKDWFPELLHASDSEKQTRLTKRYREEFDRYFAREDSAIGQ